MDTPATLLPMVMEPIAQKWTQPSPPDSPHQEATPGTKRSNPRPWEDPEWPIALFRMTPHHPKVAAMTRWCSRFARRSVLRERPLPWAVLTGKTGCGKTRAAKRAIRIVRETALDAYLAGFWGGRGKICIAAEADWPRLAEIRDERDYQDAVRDVTEADVVLLDDLGAETDTFKAGIPTSRLRRLLSDLEGKAVLITTNVPKAEWEKKWDARVASRLSAAKIFDGMEIPDFRPQLATT